jgi:DNA polymerase
MQSIPITIDFETAYSQTYSLSKMTTAEYVLSPYFEIIGVAVQLGDAPTQWFSGTEEETAQWLRQFPFEDPDYVTVIQNAHFDGAILEWRLDIHPARYFCTLMAARPLLVPYTKSASLKAIAAYLEIGQKGTEVQTFIGRWRRDFSPAELAQYGNYCKNDVELTRQIYDRLAPQLPPDEQMLIHLTTTKYTRPRIELDRELLLTRLAMVQQEKRDVLVRAQLENPDDLMSNDKFADALRSLGVEPPMKVSPTTGKLTLAFAKTDEEFKELLNHDDPLVQALVAARLKHKSTQEETRLERLIALEALNSPLAVPILYYGAHSGRFSGKDKINLQNLPRDGVLRKALRAPPGYVVLAGDLSQIEARVTAYLAGEDDLLKRFRAGEDVYRWFASSSLYHVPESAVDKQQRFVAKTSVLGMGFGIGGAKFHTVMRGAGIDMTERECKRVVQTYRQTFWRIPELWDKLDQTIAAMATVKHHRSELRRGSVLFGPKWVMLPNGMRLLYPELRQTGHDEFCYDSHRGTRMLWGGSLLENIVQALARIILTSAELFLAERGYESVLSVHDELVYIVPEAKAEKFAIALEKVLSRPVSWAPGLPVACEVNWGPTYKDCKGSWRDKKA